jgi:hypothetical protein
VNETYLWEIERSIHLTHCLLISDVVVRAKVLRTHPGSALHG